MGGWGVYTSYGIMRDKEGSIMAKKSFSTTFPSDVLYFNFIFLLV